MKKTICLVCLIIVVISTFLLYSCCFNNNYIKISVSNTTNDTIYFVESNPKSDSPSVKNLWEGALIPIAPDSTYSFQTNEETLEVWGTQYIIFETMTLRLYSIDEIRKNNIFDWGAVYYLNDLDKLRFQIIYLGKGKIEDNQNQ